MPNVFVSYGRESSATAEALANDIRSLGHEAWFDQQLTGGQAWWNQILETVRNCDVFVFLLTPKSLRSTACMGEYGYAAALRKPILPVLIADGVSTNLLPPALSQIQFVDYRNQDRSAALRLARALATIPPSEPLPDPLPAPPDVPISYLGGVTEQIETRLGLSYEQQSALIVDLQRGLRDPETAADSRALLVRLRKRRDLLATIADEVDELLKMRVAIADPVPLPLVPIIVPTLPDDARPLPPIGDVPPVSPEPQRPEPKVDAFPEAFPPMDERRLAATWGLGIGAVIGVASILAVKSNYLAYGLVTGVGVAIAGAISGKRMQMLVPAIVCAAIAWVGVVTYWWDDDGIAGAGVFGVPSGAIVGAVLGALFTRWRSRSGLSAGSNDASTQDESQ